MFMPLRDNFEEERYTPKETCSQISAVWDSEPTLPANEHAHLDLFEQDSSPGRASNDPKP